MGRRGTGRQAFASPLVRLSAKASTCFWRYHLLGSGWFDWSVLALREEAGLEHYIVWCDVLKTQPLQESFRYHVVGEIER